MSNGLAFYSENDPFAAAWLRQLIAAGLIAPGVVDERSIEDVLPSDLEDFTQCHFFAGVGAWSYALRRAGWADERRIWTGSCPCQPFSAAGKGDGFDDERHLWPAWQWLIEQCRPERIVGEQVADKGADLWVDLVHADLEGMGYAFGCVPLASAGFGAPNPRHRSFWLADSVSPRLEGRGDGYSPASGRYAPFRSIAESGEPDRLGHPLRDGAEPVGGNGHRAQETADRVDRGIPGTGVAARDAGAIGRLGDALCEPGERYARSDGGAETPFDGPRFAVDGPERYRHESASTTGGLADAENVGYERAGVADALRAGWAERRSVAGDGPPARSSGASLGAPGATNGFWRDADWLYCRDPRGARWRPVNRGTFPLAPGTPARVGTLRGSGNALNAEVATAFCEVMLEVLG